LATLPLTLQAYNDLRIRAALADHQRVIQTSQDVADDEGRPEIPGHRPTAFAEPHKQRGFDLGLYDARTAGGGFRGGRPRRHASRHQAQAAAARAYRARRRGSISVASP
jgi:hypothetical protein